MYEPGAPMGLAKDITIALINKMPPPNTVAFHDKEHPENEIIVATWIGKSYEIILDAIMKAQKKHST